MTREIYLDFNAGAPLRPEARAAALEAFDVGANASSVHARGRAARALIERARDRVARLAGAAPGEVVFTSGGAEANHLAVRCARAAGAVRLLVGGHEHSTLVAAARHADLPMEVLPVLPDGRLDLEALEAALARATAAGPTFVALMLANNETGAVQPVREAAERVRRRGGWLHVDAVAAAGRIAVRARDLDADSLALSAHKIGGLSGSGALILQEGRPCDPILGGGGQESGRRAGTENLSGVAAFGAAADAADADVAAGVASSSRTVEAARRAEARLKAAGAVIVSEEAPRTPGVLCVAQPGFPAELQVIALDLEGVRVSAGAACSSGKVSLSPTLAAMGLGDLAGCAVRASGGWSTRPEDWDHFADVWIAAAERRRRRHVVKELA